MKVVFVHISLKVYWPPRLFALYDYCVERNINFEVIELVGNNDVYTFEEFSELDCSWWKCLFPNNSIVDIPKQSLIAKLEASLEQADPDVIISGPIAYPCGAISLRWASKKNRRFVTFDDIRVANVPRNFLVNFVKQKLYDRVDGYFAPSKSYKSDLLKWGFNDGNVFYGLNCIDIAKFKRKSMRELSSFSFKGFTLDHGKKYLICVARMVPVKNHESLLLAWNLFCNRENSNGSWELLLIGSGPLCSSLRDLVKFQDIKYVHFLGDIVQNELPNYYSISSAAILPSLSESWGLVVNEAMAAGLPVLVSDKCNCSSDLVIEEYNGMSFSPTSINSILRSLVRLHESKDIVLMGTRSLDLINRYNLESFCKSLIYGILSLNDLPPKHTDTLTRIILKLWNGKFSKDNFNKPLPTV